ncbi:uncharacterized protein G6M90_00g060810 [Metarhizium brunneum]|uniref:Uncharacterized protein n=1 Tax=Metarhizium brunneum TaxID=500148 RepID=A0A7D5UY91_9HYPO|nr:hypothetical protein G6M90_00g060810 [Metarhizium brunneum]
MNDPGTTGYSVAWNPARRALRIARHMAVDDVSCYANMGDDATAWLHIPISRGELLAELWRRDCYLTSSNARSSVHVFPIIKLQRQRDYLFIDDSAGIRELALTLGPEEANETRNLRKPAPESCYPAITSVESYLYTFAPLENLDLIKTCSFAALLRACFSSTTTAREQVWGRSDWLGLEQQVPREATIGFAMSRTADQCPYVGSVLVCVAPLARNLLPAKSDLD